MPLAQSACCSRHLPTSSSLCCKNKSTSIPFFTSTPKISGSYIGERIQGPQLITTRKWYSLAKFPFGNRSIHCSDKSNKLGGSQRTSKLFYLPDSKEGTTHSTVDSSQVVATRTDDILDTNTLAPADGRIFDYREPFRGKSGSVSFCGLTHQLIEEGKLVSSPFKDDTGSFFWVLGPIALISSLLLPQFFLGAAIDTIIKDEIFADILVSLASEVLFYFGLASFLSITDRVQRPYLQFSPKRWALITGLRGYFYSAFLTMGLKVFAPILTVYIVWPVIGLPALVAVAPFLLGCAAQFAFEAYLDKRQSSCWPLVPIIFEIYRMYQLSRAAYFIQTLMMSMRGSVGVPFELAERSGALVSVLVVLHVLGAICLWSLCSFLLRLFPSRPVAERY